MTMAEMMNALNELNGRVQAAATQLMQTANNQEISMDQLRQQQSELRDLVTRRDAMQAAYAVQLARQSGELVPENAGSVQGAQGGEKPAGLREMLRSNEYARAFANAIRSGVTRRSGRGNAECKPLFDALTIAGGTTAGEDGGFLVPDDVNTMINERRRQLMPLADLFTVEPVMSQSGWRVVDTAPTTGMTAMSSENSAVSSSEQPKFAKVTFSLTTYGLIVPVSNELIADETAGLMSYLANWYAKKQVITENTLLKAKLTALTSTNLSTTAPIADLKKALNVALDPEISALSVLITNQDGYNKLDSMEDDNGRPLLQPDITSQTGMMFKGRPIHVMSNAQLATVSTTESSATVNRAPVYIGDYKSFATLFTRQGLEMTSTDVGGNAFTNNATEVRGITRMGVSVMDSAAAIARGLTV